MKTQLDKLAKLLRRPSGCTAMDIIQHCQTVSPNSRMSELKARGWIITKHKVPGRSYHRYLGNPPPLKK